ncbi:hypothetical protein JRO89_XS08G0055000 [Xanthoceras sorbifolium]|uniref:WAT1-related protein n=1 Tax=Xanthoceras sorbifolium TaxID=99658 RepID=A0ABQ8HNZ5_9ROSI|nr:hypothetical protein JRO89_XS08G0055000 [Xanthoceras sorbifolium]
MGQGSIGELFLLETDQKILGFDSPEPPRECCFKEPPPCGVLKLNTNAAVRGELSCIRNGATICHSKGAMLASLSKTIPRTNRPKLTWMIAFQGFLCRLFGGALSQNLNIVSLRLTSATFVTAMGILVPSLTFVLALIFRFGDGEVGNQENGRIAKVVGTLVSLGGVMILIFYKGIEINIWSTKINLLKHKTNDHNTASHHHQLSGQLLGSLLAVVGGLSYAIWFVLQHSSNAGYALCMEKDFSARKLGWNIRLLTTLYTYYRIRAHNMWVVWRDMGKRQREGGFGYTGNDTELEALALAS